MTLAPRRVCGSAFACAAIASLLLLGAGCVLFRDGQAKPLPDPELREKERQAVLERERNPARPPRLPKFEGPRAPYRRPTPSVLALRRALDSILDQPELAGTSHGVHVVSLATGEVLYSRDADVLLRPASCHKLFTTAAALELLGTDHVFKTPFYAEGAFDQRSGRLDGSIIVRGVGDPSRSGRYDLSGKSTDAYLDEWADALWRAGVREVSGGVVVDASFFQGAAINPTWEVDDLDYSYAAAPWSLSINDSCVDIVATPAAKPGEPASIRLSPRGADSYFRIKGAVTTAAPGEKVEPSIRRDLAENTLVLSGAIAADDASFATWRAVVDGDLWSAHLIDAALRRRGAKLGAPPSVRREARSADPGKLLYEMESPPLHQLVAVINKPSQNQHAEMLLRDVGAASGHGASLEGGGKALEELLAKTGVATTGFVSADGSGLSWRNLATARQIARLLAWAADRPWAAQFYNSLPVAGVDGTLELRLTDGPANGNARAKTGYINKTRSMCGYLATRTGERLAFAILTNNYPGPTSRVNAAHDAIAQALAGWEGDR